MRNKSLLLFAIFSLLATSSYGLNQQVLTDSLRSFASKYAVLEARVRIKSIRQTNSVLHIETNPSLSCISYTPERVEELKGIVRRVSGVGNNIKIEIITDGYEVSELISNHYIDKDHRRQPNTIKSHSKPLVTNYSLPYTITNGLQNRHIALWASHGRYFDQESDRWKWQRANLLETVEDLLTSSFTMPFLVPMLENAGAIVIQPRERDTQINEVVMNGNDAVGDDHKAWFLPDIPADGNYAVYGWWEQSDEISDHTTYYIMHDGGETELKVNQQMGGHTWNYLGTYFFRAGQDENNGVRIEGLGHRHTNRLSECRIKFGGGMGSIGRNSSKTDSITRTSGLPRWMEGARYWMEYAGIPDSVYLFSEGTSDYKDDYACRGRWLNYLCGGSAAYPDHVGLRIPLDAGLAFHTDAGVYRGDTIVGTLAIYTNYNNDKSSTLPNGVSRLTIRDYADRIQTQVVDDIRKTYAPEWSRRELRNSSYSETRNPEVPTIILELLSHQNIADMRYGHDPRFKFLVSRAVYKGILRYLADQYDFEYIVQPLPVHNFAISRQGTDSLYLSWEPTTDTLEPTAKPSYYIVYQQIDEGGWNNGIKVNDTHICLPIEHNQLYSFKIAAGNNGGISLPSEILAAYTQANDSMGTALIINGFTRICAPEYVEYNASQAGFNPNVLGIAYGKEISFSGKQYEFRRNLKWVSDDNPGFGASYQNYNKTLEIGNTFDYPILHGKAIAKLGYSFVSASVGSVEKIDSTYSFTDIILGKQKPTIIGTTKQTKSFAVYPNNLITALTDYAQQKGNILISGSYIGSGLTTDECAFAKNVLHYKPLTQKASKNGTIYSLSNYQSYQLLTEPNEVRIPTESPDGISATDKNAQTIMRYADSEISAGIKYSGEHKIVVLGFPIESLADDKQIDNLLQSVTHFFEK